MSVEKTTNWADMGKRSLLATLVVTATLLGQVYPSLSQAAERGADVEACPEPGLNADLDAAIPGRCSVRKEEKRPSRPYTEAEQQGVGCLSLGGMAVLTSYTINTDELLMIAAGGTLASTSAPVVALSLLSTVAAGGCAVGAIAAPIFLRWYEDGYQYLQDLKERDWSFSDIHDRETREGKERDESWFRGVWSDGERAWKRLIEDQPSSDATPLEGTGESTATVDGANVGR